MGDLDLCFKMYFNKVCKDVHQGWLRLYVALNQFLICGSSLEHCKLYRPVHTMQFPAVSNNCFLPHFVRPTQAVEVCHSEKKIKFHNVTQDIPKLEADRYPRCHLKGYITWSRKISKMETMEAKQEPLF